MVTRVFRKRGVLEILAEIETWESFVGPTGAQLYRIPTGSGLGTYTVSPTSCTCPQDQYRRHGQVCKHRAALSIALKVQRALNRLQGEQSGVAPARQPSEQAAAPAHPARTDPHPGGRLAG